MAIFVKFIKPRPVNTKGVERKILNALAREGQLSVRAFNKTTGTWRGAKPIFSIRVTAHNDAKADVRPSGDVEGVKKWTLLEQGTSEHPITPKRAPKLRFRHGSGFKAKTRVRTLSSGAGANTGPFISVKEVKKHPGTEAREWTKTLVERRKKPFAKAMQKAAQYN